jgi:hypothetical protein
MKSPELGNPISLNYQSDEYSINSRKRSMHFLPGIILKLVIPEVFKFINNFV